MQAQTSQATSWFHDLLSTLAVASGVGYLATAYTISRWLTRPAPCQPLKPETMTGVDWETLECGTRDGIRLVGWSAQPARPRATLLLFHGLRGNRAETLARIAFLTAAGYRCLAFDHRGHGESGGHRTSFGYFENLDVEAVIDAAEQRWPGQPLAALGISMGAAAVCFAAKKCRRLAAIVLESLYHDLAGAFAARVGCGFPAWFGRFSRGVIWITEKRLGVGIAKVAPSEEIAKLEPAPVLLLTGSEDPHAPAADVEKLLKRCRGPREFHLIEGAGHCDLHEYGGLQYRQLILEFLSRHVP